MTHLIGDIGNTETKLCILNKSFKIVRRLKIDTLKINNQYYFKKMIFSFVQNKIRNKKALFSSVVPSILSVFKKRRCNGNGFTGLYRNDNGIWKKLMEFNQVESKTVSTHISCEEIKMVDYE